MLVRDLHQEQGVYLGFCQSLLPQIIVLLRMEMSLCERKFLRIVLQPLQGIRISAVSERDQHYPSPLIAV